jgi:hypothetical protein
MRVPRSPYDKEASLVWVPRMLDKARLMHEGELPEDYHPNLGKGHDDRCCTFLQVDYDDITKQIEDGSDDSTIAEWCFANGRRPTDLDIELWNGFMTKLGWNDENERISAAFADRKKAYGIEDRDDIQTFFRLIEYDEERTP